MARPPTLARLPMPGPVLEPNRVPITLKRGPDFRVVRCHEPLGQAVENRSYVSDRTITPKRSPASILRGRRFSTGGSGQEYAFE